MFGGVARPVSHMNKFSAEQAISRRRQARYDQQQQYNQAASFYNKGTIGALQNKKWDSDYTFEKSMRAWDKQNNVIDKKEALRKRQDKLRATLEKEKDQWSIEIAEMVPTMSDRIQTMRIKKDGLKTARESERVQQASKKRTQQLRENNVDYRDFSQKQHGKHVESERTKQLAQRQIIDEQEKSKHRALEKMVRENEKRRERELQARDAESKRKTMHVHQGRKQQIEELRGREAEAERLRNQNIAIEMELKQLAHEEQQRTHRDEQLQHVRYGKQLQRQHRLALQRQSQQIQASLEHDMRFLEELAEVEKAEKAHQTERRDKSRDDVRWMKKEVLRQLEEERGREIFFEDMYRDEARRVQAQQEAVWDRERHAREKLMRQVLAERQLQLEEKRDRVRQKQAQSVTAREELLSLLEEQHDEREQAQETHRDQVMTRRQELDHQLTQRALQEKQRRDRQAREEESRRKEEERTRREVEMETNMLQTQYSAPRFGRVRVAWN
eukprot:m.114150 g.114150  ORF g.114150 m.114150 type:complete len:499 (-) comp28333_c0_seq2:123-1619(-)